MKSYSGIILLPAVTSKLKGLTGVAVVGVFGKGPLAIRTCELVRAREGLSLGFIVPCSPEPDWSESVTLWAHMNSVRVLSLDVFLDEFVNGIDLGISCYFDRIFKVEHLRLMKLAVNVHNSLLPKYAGKAPVERAYKSADGVIGVTLHQIDRGIDTGPIYKQVAKELDRTRTLYEVYDECVAMGTSLVADFLSHYPDVCFVPQSAAPSPR